MDRAMLATMKQLRDTLQLHCSLEACCRVVSLLIRPYASSPTQSQVSAEDCFRLGRGYNQTENNQSGELPELCT